MSEPTLSDTVTLANSELKKIAERVANTVIIAAEKISVENQFKPEKDSYEFILQERLRTFNKKKVEQIRQKVLPIYEAARDIRETMYGELGTIDHKSATSIKAAESKLPPVSIRKDLLGFTKIPAAGLTADGRDNPKITTPDQEIFNPHDTLSIDALTGGGPVFGTLGGEMELTTESAAVAAQSVTSKLGLYIRRIKCVDETNPELFGHDEIALGGTSVDETGDTMKIGEKYIGGGFDDGDSKWFSPRWKWHWFNMQEGDHWPKSYFLTFVLAEKDMGGLSNFLHKLFEKVKDHVLEVLAAALGGALGVLGPLGPIIGAAVGYIVAKVVEWFINLWNDDVFPPKTVSCTVPGFGARWFRNGQMYTTSDVRRAHFFGHGGHYYIEYYWRLFS